MKKILQDRRGETIVEVLVSFVLLLMFTALFVVSLRYARRMAQKAETLRSTAYAYCADLYPANNAPTKWETVSGHESDTFDFGQFQISRVALQEVETKAKVTENDTETEQTHIFHRYTAGAGGTQP